MMGDHLFYLSPRVHQLGVPRPGEPRSVLSFLHFSFCSFADSFDVWLWFECKRSRSQVANSSYSRRLACFIWQSVYIKQKM